MTAKPFWQIVKGSVLLLSERAWLSAAAKTLEERFGEPVIVNIGIMQGASMHCLRAGAPAAKLFGVDLNITLVLRPDMLQATLLKGNSKVLWKTFKYPIHCLFVDGDHRYATMQKDIAGWVPKIAVGGVVIFHDYNPAEKDKGHCFIEGVKRSVDEYFTRCATPWQDIPTVGSLKVFKRLP